METFLGMEWQLGVESLEWVASVTVLGRPVPWQVVTGRRARRRGAGSIYAEWKSAVQREATIAMVGRRSIVRPCIVHTLFYLRPAVGRQKVPDLDNLRKGMVDALQGDEDGIGGVYVNDTLVTGGLPWRTIESDCEERSVAHVFTFDRAESEGEVVARRRLLRPADRDGVRAARGPLRPPIPAEASVDLDAQHGVRRGR